MRDFIIKSGLDVGASLTFTSLLADVGKQFLMASIIVIVNVLLYPVLKALLKALNKKFKLDLKDEEIENASKQITEETKKIIEEKDDKK